MRKVLYYYDIYPKIFPTGEETEITIRPLSDMRAFPAGEYKITVHSIDGGHPGHEFTKWNSTEYELEPGDDGYLRFSYTAKTEGQYRVRIYRKNGGEYDCLTRECAVYALDEDLASTLPLRGDFHMHTCRSDGREDPGTVCANYRAIGYDFIVVTDHGRYYSSLEAIDDYRNADVSLNIIPGEEVHMPLTDMHIINAGGTFSINGLLTTSAQYADCGEDKTKRSIDGCAPEMITREQYEAEIRKIESEIKGCPADVNLTWYAVAVWVYRKISEAGGLCVFAHPYWIANMYHIPEPLTRYMMENHPFDAFEVLGGENYYEQNGFQTALYYDEYRKGRVHAIVGSTDSHGSTEYNRDKDICSTIVFAKSNTREDIITAVKNKMSVAVDTISKEYRLVGEMRLQKYASFLMEYYFPLHDIIAKADGEIMLEYYRGDCGPDECGMMKKKAKAFEEKYIRRG